MSSHRTAVGNLLSLVVLLCAASFCFSQEPTVRDAIPAPPGCVRQHYPAGSYSNWMQRLPLKPAPVILDYQGRTVNNGAYNTWKVVRLPLLFRSDLEQCADFAMRFWAEYHKGTGILDHLYLFDYGGHKSPFSRSGKTYPQFLKWAFANTNSSSLKKGCRPISADQMAPGDMFIQNERGGIGHVSVAVDACKSAQGTMLFLVGYSFMPAQEFHIEKAKSEYGTDGWFTVEGYIRYLRDTLNFGRPELRRFDP
jgi:hypothetical protein